MEGESGKLAKRLRSGAAWIGAHGRGTICALQEDLEKAADVLDGTDQQATEDEQLSLLPEATRGAESCFLCRHFSELKIPRVLDGGGCIYGYCFKDGTKPYNTNMGKGYPVYIPLAGPCSSFKKETRSEAERRMLVKNAEEDMK